MEERDVLERISAMEVQIKEISEVKSKLDSLYNLIVELKLDNVGSRGNYTTKQDCGNCRRSLEKRMEEMESGRKRLFWASLSAGTVFVLWLIEQLMHVTLKIGG